MTSAAIQIQPCLDRPALMCRAFPTDRATGQQDDDHHRERQQRADARHRNGQDFREQIVAGQGHAERLDQIEQRIIDDDGKGLDQSHQDRGDEAAGERAEPAEHHDHEDDRSHRLGHAGFGGLVVAADHAGETGEQAAAGEHDGEDPRHVVAERARHLRMGQGRLDDQADAGFFQQQPCRHQHADGNQQHEAAIGWKVGAIDGEQRKVQQRRHPIGHRQHAPDHLHAALDDEHHAEGEKQFGDVAIVMDPPEAPDLDGGADQAAQNRRDDEGGKEAEQLAQRERQIRADHVDAGMGEIQHAHHAEDQRQAAGQHEQQHAVDQTIEQGNEDYFHDRSFSRIDALSSRDQFSGRFILQIVGSVRSAAEAVMMFFQPKPVCSESNLTSLLKTPA